MDTSQYQLAVIQAQHPLRVRDREARLPLPRGPRPLALPEVRTVMLSARGSVWLPPCDPRSPSHRSGKQGLTDMPLSVGLHPEHGDFFSPLVSATLILLSLGFFSFFKLYFA